MELFAILQKYDFSSKSQLMRLRLCYCISCLRYCKSTIFQANHNRILILSYRSSVVCDTAKVRFFKQITTYSRTSSSVPQLFAILQKYDFSSKSQHRLLMSLRSICCLRYCKSTIFQANHNPHFTLKCLVTVVCDTAKVRFFKQITTNSDKLHRYSLLFAILQKYDFSSKSQRNLGDFFSRAVVCDTAKVRFFKQITTRTMTFLYAFLLFVILQKYDFSSKSQQWGWTTHIPGVVCDTAKVRFFKQITTWHVVDTYWSCLDF